MLDRKINSKGLEITVESNDVEMEVNATMQAHGEELPEVTTARYSTTTYILMGMGGLVVITMGVGALVAAIWERVRKGARQALNHQLAMLEEAKAPAKKYRLEVEYRADVIAVEPCEKKEARKVFRMVEL